MSTLQEYQKAKRSGRYNEGASHIEIPEPLPPKKPTNWRWVLPALNILILIIVLYMVYLMRTGQRFSDFPKHRDAIYSYFASPACENPNIGSVVEAFFARPLAPGEHRRLKFTYKYCDTSKDSIHFH